MIGAGTLVWDGTSSWRACRATGWRSGGTPTRSRSLFDCLKRSPKISFVPLARPVSTPTPPLTVITQFVRTPHFQGRPSVFMAAATAALIPDLVYFSFFLFRNCPNFIFVWLHPADARSVSCCLTPSPRSPRASFVSDRYQLTSLQRCRNARNTCSFGGSSINN